MAVTVANKNLGDKLENLTVTRTTITFDSSYPNTGGTVGEPLTHAQLGLSKVAFADVNIVTPGGSVVAVVYDEVNSVLRAYTASAQVANGVDLATLVVQVVAFGTP